MQLTNRRVRLMGTVIDVSIYHKEPEPLLDQVEALLHTYNKRFSANDDSSELMKINKAAGLHPVTVHPELFELISLGKWHSCQPGSHLNIAIGPLIQTWRIGFSDAKLPLPEEIRPLLDIINPNAILLSEETQSVFLKEKGMKIDLGALAKGYIADRIADFLKAEKVTSALINLKSAFIDSRSDHRLVSYSKHHKICVSSLLRILNTNSPFVVWIMEGWSKG